MRQTLRNLTLQIFAISLILISCQKDDMVTQDQNVLDQDMQTAIAMAEDYLTNVKGRSADDAASVTVFRYYEGKLWYQTYIDGVTSYEEVTEETVTAEAAPGEYVFWYGGYGLRDLDEIDFDDISEAHLEKDADEVYDDLLWAIMIPYDIAEKTDYLKYDIVYQYDGNLGPVIRLDPKIRIKGEGEHTDNPEN